MRRLERKSSANARLLMTLSLINVLDYRGALGLISASQSLKAIIFKQQ